MYFNMFTDLHAWFTLSATKGFHGSKYVTPYSFNKCVNLCYRNPFMCLICKTRIQKPKFGGCFFICVSEIWRTIKLNLIMKLTMQMVSMCFNLIGFCSCFLVGNCREKSHFQMVFFSSCCICKVYVGWKITLIIL